MRNPPVTEQATAWYPESSVVVFVLAGWLLGLVTGALVVGIVLAVTG